MRKLWLVLKREYLTRVRTRTFLLTTLLLPVFFIGMIAFSVALARRHPGRVMRIAIVDEVGGLADRVSKELTPQNPGAHPDCQVVRSLDRPADPRAVLRELREQVHRGEMDGYLVLTPDVVEGQAAEFHTRNPGDFTVIGSIRHAVNAAVVARRFADQGVRVENLDEMMEGVDLKLVRLTASGETEERGQTFISALIMAGILYTTLIMYGVATMRSVLEEKTTRIMEILVASVRPRDLLAGKILGVAAVALTQYLIWTISAGLLVAYGAAMARAVNPQARSFAVQLPITTLIFLVIFGLAGYFLYASLYAAVGAAVSSEEDAQQLQWPVTLPLIVSFLLFNVILRDSNSTASVVLSLIPFFAPILMVFRIAIQMPPLWQVALSLVLMVLTNAGIVYFSSRIYRVGILMYGKRPSLVELVRWLRYT